MREMSITCDFCGKVHCEESGEGFFVIEGTADDIDVCPRCMAILEDEVRKRLKERR